MEVLLVIVFKRFQFIYCCDSVGNVLFTGGVSTGSALRELAAECGFEVTEENSSLIDHLNYDANDSGKVMTFNVTQLPICFNVKNEESWNNNPRNNNL